jgi:hypothetical protein
MLDDPQLIAAKWYVGELSGDEMASRLNGETWQAAR